MSNYATAVIGSPAPPPTLSIDPQITEWTVFNADRAHRFTSVEDKDETEFAFFRHAGLFASIA
ncbi:MAG: hypothetical protein PHI97_23065, partial [Desulfobulbus sp.]|nr:hypothetical protein [Desulfobulbus sp.]